MRKLDRLGWAAGLRFESYGIPIGLRTNLGKLPAEVLQALPPHWQPVASRRVTQLYSFFFPDQVPSRQRRFFLIYAGAERIARSLDRDRAVAVFRSHLERYVAEFSRREIFLHAGAVALKGKAILFPGRSMTGKSTLVAALVGAGATYLSDEFALLDKKGMVSAFPVPISLRNGDASPAISSPGLGRKFPIAAVVFTRYREGANFRPHAISAGRSFLGLLANTVQARTREKEAFHRLRAACQAARFFQSPRGDARGAADQILSLI